NSPPFYRLNYRGIVVESYLSGEKTFVKHQFAFRRATGASINKLLLLATIYREKCFAGLAFLYHHLKCSFNFSH
ncbi:DUF5951 family protein, partial [Klebsiella oxytoca]